VHPGAPAPRRPQVRGGGDLEPRLQPGRAVQEPADEPDPGGHPRNVGGLKAIEVYRERLVLYGCGDLLDDYEGIGGYEAFRPDLRLMHLVRVDPDEGRVAEAGLVPVQPRRFRLKRASAQDARWLRDLLTRLGEPFGTRVELAGDRSLALRWR